MVTNRFSSLTPWPNLASCTSKRTSAQLPAFDSFDPSDAVIPWSLILHTNETETTLHEVFEFVEGLCKLEITVNEAALPSPAQQQACAGGNGETGGEDRSRRLQRPKPPPSLRQPLPKQPKRNRGAQNQLFALIWTALTG